MCANDASFEERLHNAICAAYDKPKLERMVSYRLQVRFDTIADLNSSLHGIVFSLIQWARRQSRVPNLTRSLASYREHGDGENRELVELAEEVNATQPVVAPAQPAATALPPDVEVLTQSYDLIPRVVNAGPDRLSQMERTAGQLRAVVNALVRPAHGLADRFHLSGSAGQRLAAVLALRQAPEARYLRWLSERAGVEAEPVGFQAACALAHAALRLPPSHFGDVEAAAQDALDRLKGDAAGGRQRAQLGEALSILRLRAVGLPRVAALSFDEVCLALGEAFTSPADRELIGLRSLAARVGLRLERVAKLDEHPEYIVGRLVRLAWQNDWERDLIDSAMHLQGTSPRLANVSARYNQLV